MCRPRLEHADNRLPEAIEVEGRELAHKDDVDQVLRAGAGLVVGVTAGVRVQLLGDVLLQLDRADVRRFDLREVEQVGCCQLVGWREGLTADADVDKERLEEPPANVGVGVEADATSAADVGVSDALDVELEVVVERERGSLDESVRRFVERGGPVDVYVTCRPSLAGGDGARARSRPSEPIDQGRCARVGRAGE